MTKKGLKHEKLPSIRVVEIPCPTCLTWSHFIQDKLKISIYLSLDKYKCNNEILYIIFLVNYYEFTCCIENSVDPDQLASSEASWSGSTLFRRELKIGFLLFSKV